MTTNRARYDAGAPHAPPSADAWAGAISDDVDAHETGKAASPHTLGGADHSADTLANLNGKISDATLDTDTATRTPTDGTVTGAKMASGVTVWWFDAGANASAARPAGAAANDVVIWTNTPSVPANLGTRDQWEDAS